jgi:hypothetical protein
MNTVKKGSVRYIVFKEVDTWYAVGLEFNIVESGDDPQIAMFGLFEAIAGYVEAFKKIKGARPAVLNQKPDKEYEDMWNKLASGSPIKSPYSIYTFGTRPLATV